MMAGNIQHRTLNIEWGPKRRWALVILPRTHSGLALDISGREAGWGVHRLSCLLTGRIFFSYCSSITLVNNAAETIIFHE